MAMSVGDLRFAVLRMRASARDCHRTIWWRRASHTLNLLVFVRTIALRGDRCVFASQVFLQSVQFAASSWLPLVRFVCSPPRLAKVC